MAERSTLPRAEPSAPRLTVTKGCRPPRPRIRFRREFAGDEEAITQFYRAALSRPKGPDDAEEERED